MHLHFLFLFRFPQLLFQVSLRHAVISAFLSFILPLSWYPSLSVVQAKKPMQLRYRLRLVLKVFCLTQGGRRPLITSGASIQGETEIGRLVPLMLESGQGDKMTSKPLLLKSKCHRESTSFLGQSNEIGKIEFPLVAPFWRSQWSYCTSAVSSLLYRPIELHIQKRKQAGR